MTYVYKKFYILVNRIVYNCLHIEFLLIIIILLIVTVSLINRVPRDLIRHCVELWKHITIYRSRTLFNEFWVISILCNYLKRSMEIRVCGELGAAFEWTSAFSAALFASFFER